MPAPSVSKTYESYDDERDRLSEDRKKEEAASRFRISGTGSLRIPSSCSLRSAAPANNSGWVRFRTGRDSLSATFGS